MSNYHRYFGCFLVCLLFGVAEASAHQWKIGKTRVEATVEHYDGKLVTFRPLKGRVFRVPVEKLVAEDLPVLRNVLALKGLDIAARRAAVAPAPAPAPIVGPPQAAQLASNSQRTLAVLERSLAVQSAQYWSQWYDLWVVQFQAPNGYAFWVTSPARNSYDAEVAARRQYPTSNVLWVQRLRRR